VANVPGPEAGILGAEEDEEAEGLPFPDGSASAFPSAFSSGFPLASADSVAPLGSGVGSGDGTDGEEEADPSAASEDEDVVQFTATAAAITNATSAARPPSNGPLLFRPRPPEPPPDRPRPSDCAEPLRRRRDGREAEDPLVEDGFALRAVVFMVIKSEYGM
jgi:hypothetical protein